MNYIMTVAFRMTMFHLVIVCCCGFTWGLGKSDPCLESRSTIDILHATTDPTKRANLEETILKACPNGAAGLFIRAEQAEKVSKPDIAMSLYREALALDASISDAHGNLGLLLHDHGFDDEASVELTKALMGRSDPRYHRSLANIISKNALPSLSLFHYSEALKAFPDDVDIHQGLANAYIQIGQLDKAEAEFNRLKSIKPSDAIFQKGLAEVYRKTHQLDKAIEELNSYIRHNPANKDGHRLLAEVFMEKGDHKAARREFLAAGVDVSINPEDFVRKGDDFTNAREFGLAIGSYQTALNNRPGWKEVQYKLAKAQMSAGRDDDALVTLTPLLKSSYNDGAIYHDLGVLRERSGQLDEAISAYRLSIIHNPENVNALRRLAEISIWRGNFKEAADHYRELIRLREDNPLYHLNLAGLYERMKDMKNAVAEYEIALRLDPANLEGHRELAKVYIRLSQITKGEAHFKEVIRLNNEDESARNALISLYVRQKRYDELTKFIKDWLDKAPDDPQRHYRMGIVYEFKKEYVSAIAEYKKSIELSPDNAKMLSALGRTYMKSGRISESREILEKAKSADPTLAEPQLLLSSISSRQKTQKKSISAHKTRTKKQQVLPKKSRKQKNKRK